MGGTAFEIEEICSDDICHFRNVLEPQQSGPKPLRCENRSAHLPVETRLNFDLTFQKQFLGITLASLVPLLQDLSETGSIDLDELLEFISGISDCPQLLTFG